MRCLLALVVPFGCLSLCLCGCRNLRERLAAPAHVLQRIARRHETFSTRYSDCLTRTVLPNGLVVIVDEHAHSRMVHCILAVKAGALDEWAGEEGASHILEHLLFHDHATHPYTRKLLAGGGVLNAETSFTETVYYLDCLADEFQQGLTGLFDLVILADFTRDDLALEKKVVLEECAEYQSDPLGIMAFSLARRLFPDTALAYGILGTRTSIHRMSYERLKRYHRAWYQPNNMIMVVSGNVRTHDILSKVTAYTASMPARELPARTRYQLQTHTGKRELTFKIPVNLCYYANIYYLPGDGMRDYWAAVIFDAMLVAREDAWLRKSLYQSGHVADLGVPADYLGGMSFMRGSGGITGIVVSTSLDALRTVKEQCAAAVAFFRETLCSNERLGEIKDHLLFQVAGRLENPREFSEFYLARELEGHFMTPEQFSRAIRSFTPEELRRFAARIYREDNLMELQVIPASGLARLWTILKYFFTRSL